MHLGSRMFLMSKLRLDFILPLPDAAELDFPLFLRSVACLGPASPVPDLVGSESSISLRQSCHLGLTSSALGLTCLDLVSSSSVIDWTILGFISLLQQLA